MTISYLLAPIPKWYIADLTGKPLAAGKMYTYSNLDPTLFKYVYQDPGGNEPWTDPIIFDENGSSGPFYWKSDSTNLSDTYYIEVYDANGVLQWTISDFFPNGSGGGGNVTTALNLTNLISNNVMWRNLGASANPIGTTFLKLAPGAHAALAQTSSNSGPDICFIKNNTAATDQLIFKDFILGSNVLTGDVTPTQYLKYTCGNTPAGETYKAVQFPISQNVQNLSNQNVTVTIWARCNSGNTSLILQWKQFFGDDTSPPPTVISDIMTLTLTSAWTKYIINTTVPDVTGKTIGACHNDGLFFLVQYPLGVATDIDFIKPAVYLGNIAPTEDYLTYDMIDGVINAPRTGYVFPSYDLIAPFGYIMMNDGTIGSESSGATSRANADVFPLYNWLWTNVSNPTANAFCPVTGGLGASAVADFTANKTLQLQLLLGRAIASAGAGSGLTARGLGQFLGEESHILTTNEMPIHNHPGSTVSSSPTLNYSPGGSHPLVDYPIAKTSALGLPVDFTSTVASQGGDGAHNIMQPTSFLNFFIKL